MQRQTSSHTPPDKGVRKSCKEDGGKEPSIRPTQEGLPAERKGEGSVPGWGSATCPKPTNLLPLASPAQQGRQQAAAGSVHSTFPSFPAPTYISLYTRIYRCTHARTHRGPCDSHVQQGEGDEGKEDRESGRGSWGQERLRCQGHSNQCQTKKTERMLHPTSPSPEGRETGGHPMKP